MTSRLERFRHIAIEGPIGAGKTTLAKLLAPRLSADLLLERPSENPFLDRFYADMPGYAFQTQLFFLFQRQKQVQAIAQPSMFETRVVSDFMLAKDALFARVTLGDDEYRWYAQMYAQVAAQVRPPDLVIYLQARAETLLERVRRRGIGMEQRIEVDYLQRLVDAYAEHFAAYDAGPILAVDSERFDPLSGPMEVDALIERIERFDGGRDRFDPKAPAPPLH